jgi:uncharacterized membrane protein YGL010W
LMAL